MVIYLGRRLLDGSSGLPGGRNGPEPVLPPVWPCFRWGLPSRPVARSLVGSYPAVSPLPTPPRGCRRFTFCCTFPDPARRPHGRNRRRAGGRYPPPCPVKPGLSSSSPRATSDHPSGSRKVNIWTGDTVRGFISAIVIFTSHFLLVGCAPIVKSSGFDLPSAFSDDPRKPISIAQTLSESALAAIRARSERPVRRNRSHWHDACSVILRETMSDHRIHETRITGDEPTETGRIEILNPTADI